MAKNEVKLHPKLAKWCANMEKRVGLDDVLVKPSFKMQCINTGSTVLNMLIGGSRLEDGSFVCPGYPKGKIIEIFGRESSGKSTLALTAMGQTIANGGVGLYVDLEHAVVDNYAIKLGVDFRPPALGGNGMALRVAPHNFEETETLVDGAALQGVDIIVIDSVAALVSRRETQRDVNDPAQKLGMAEVPRLMSGWLPKLQTIIAKTNTTVIFLNQTRDNIGAGPMARSEESKKSTTGGNALKFYASIRWLLQPRMSAKAKVWNPLLKENEEVPIATDVIVKNIKNKIDARQGHSGLITLRYGVGIDEMRTMMNIACAYEIVKKGKNGKKQETFLYKSPGLGKTIEAVGIEKFRMELRSAPNQGAFEEMMEQCQARIMQGFRAIDDEELSRLAGDAVTTEHKDEDDDEYLQSNPPQDVDPSEMGIEEVDSPSIDASDV